MKLMLYSNTDNLFLQETFSSFKLLIYYNLLLLFIYFFNITKNLHYVERVFHLKRKIIDRAVLLIAGSIS